MYYSLQNVQITLKDNQRSFGVEESEQSSDEEGSYHTEDRSPLEYVKD